jgi:hypothetical protein
MLDNSDHGDGKLVLLARIARARQASVKAEALSRNKNPAK